VPREPLFRRLALATHLGLGAALVFALAGLGSAPALQLLLIVLALLPLVATLRGLWTGRRQTLRWLALALVGYTGLGAVEIIARGDPATTAVMLLSLVELALVLSLVRAPRSPAPRATAES
jgi:hypothetical protein